jgi:hypothetical protein
LTLLTRDNKRHNFGIFRDGIRPAAEQLTSNFPILDDRWDPEIAVEMCTGIELVECDKHPDKTILRLLTCAKKRLHFALNRQQFAPVWRRWVADFAMLEQPDGSMRAH